MNRETYLEALQSRLEDWGVELDRLESKARSAPAAVRARYEAQAAAFRHHLDDVGRQCAALRTSGATGWKVAQQAAEDACDRMRLALLRLETECMNAK